MMTIGSCAMNFHIKRDTTWRLMTVGSPLTPLFPANLFTDCYTGPGVISGCPRCPTEHRQSTRGWPITLTPGRSIMGALLILTLTLLLTTAVASADIITVVDGWTVYYHITGEPTTHFFGEGTYLFLLQGSA